jgi:pimeloyl-ACP methyl ester carboxylesterase
MKANNMNIAGGGHYATVNDIQMYYEVHGSGFPLVLIHGGGSTIDTSFGTIIPLLARSNRVIAVEMQAHGRTADRDVPESFAQDADDIAALLQQLGISRANVLGFSNGGQTTIQLALSHPQRVNKLIIASAFYNRSGVFEGFWKGFDHPELSNMPQVYHDAFLKVNNNPAALLNMFNRDVERMRNFEGWTDADLRSIMAPALVLIGDQDLPPAEHAALMSRLLPNGRLAILPGNHGSYMGEAMSPKPNSKMPGVFAGLIDAFLTEE